MPELPDITVYVEALERRIVGERLERVRVNNPFVVRTFEPPLEAINGKRVRQIRQVGKRIAIGLDDALWLVLHLMIAGRLHWKPPGAKVSGKFNLAAFDFSKGSLLLTEAGTKRRASLYLLQGDNALRTRPGGVGHSLDNARQVPGHPATAQSYAEASPHRPLSIQWNRQRLLR